MLESKELHLEKVHTSENGSDMFIKVLPQNQLEGCREKRAW